MTEPSRETAKPTYSQEELSAADKRADARHDKLKIDSAEPALSAEQVDLQSWLDKNYPAEKWSKYQRDLLSVAWNAALDSTNSKPAWGSVEHYDAAWSAFGGDDFNDLHKKLSIDHIRRLFAMFVRCGSMPARDDGIEAAAKLIRKRLDGIYEDHAYTEQDTGATVIASAEIEGRANELEELEEEILALKGGK